jgi:hypothetical protein
LITVWRLYVVFVTGALADVSEVGSIGLCGLTVATLFNHVRSPTAYFEYRLIIWVDRLSSKDGLGIHSILIEFYFKYYLYIKFLKIRERSNVNFL